MILGFLLFAFLVLDFENGFSIFIFFVQSLIAIANIKAIPYPCLTILPATALSARFFLAASVFPVAASPRVYLVLYSFFGFLLMV